MRRKPPPREDLPQRPRAKDFVKPLTLGDIATGIDPVIEAECTWCRHNARLEVAPLIERLGRDASFRDLKEHLVCSACGWRYVEAWPTRRDAPNYYDRESASGMPATKPTPYPSLSECRAVLAAVPRVPGVAYEQHHAYMQALMDRFPEINAGQALFIVQHLKPSAG